jgi:hypothetical protein
VKDVEVRYEKIVVQPNRERARTERERLRDAAARGSRVPITAEPAGCPAQTGGATRAELLGYGEAIIGLAEQAARDHAGLEACLAAWPR